MKLPEGCTCKHVSCDCCDKAVRHLEIQLAEAKKELESYKEFGGCKDIKTISYLQRERDKLQAEVTRLSGKTGCCMQCEAYAKELAKLRAELADMTKDRNSEEKWAETYHQQAESLRSLCKELVGASIVVRDRLLHDCGMGEKEFDEMAELLDVPVLRAQSVLADATGREG